MIHLYQYLSNTTKIQQQNQKQPQGEKKKKKSKFQNFKN
jgi:hypothetical protein